MFAATISHDFIIGVPKFIGIISKKNPAWQTTLCDLLNFPSKTLGRGFGEFLRSNNFKLEPKLKNQLCFHLLTGIGITVWGEIGLQYYLLANGKISLYLAMVIATGTLFYPEK